MILKIIGAALVLLSSGLGGVYYGCMDMFRQNDLSQMKRALGLLKGDIEFALSTLPEAMDNIAARIEEPTRRIFEQFAACLREKAEGDVCDIWARCLDENAGRTYFNGEDMAALKQFGRALGFLDRNMQLGNIAMASEYLDAQINALELSKRKNRRMYQSACLLVGLLAVVILF